MANELDAIQPQPSPSYDPAGNELDQLQANGNSQAPQLPSTLSASPDNQPQQMQQAPTAQNPAPGSDAAPVPFWKRILMGAFAGMANSAGAHNWGQALGQGAGGAMKQEQQVFENQQQQANTQSQIRFRDAQDAYNAAMLHVQQGHLDLLTAAERRAAQKQADDQALSLQNNYGATVHPIPVGAAGSAPATAFLNQASAQPGGAEVSPWTIAGPDQMYAVSFDGEQGPVKRYQVYADTAKGFNLPVADRQLVMGLNRQQQMTLEQLPSRYLNGSDENGKPYSKANEGQLRSAIEQAQESIKQLSADPENNAQALSNWQTRLVHLNSQMAGMNQANDASTKRQMQVAGARATAFNDSKIIPTTNDDGTSGFATGKMIRNSLGQGGSGNPAPAAAGTPATAAAAPTPKFRPNANGQMYMATLPDGSQVAGTQNELAAAGASNPTKMAADEIAKVHIARQLVAPNGLFHNVSRDLKELGDDKLGPVASRLNDFLAGKVGTGPEFAQLRTDMGLLSTALMQAHVGARGSEGMMEHFDALANYHISDAKTLKAALGHEFNYVNEKAAFVPKKGK